MEQQEGQANAPLGRTLHTLHDQAFPSRLEKQDWAPQIRPARPAAGRALASVPRPHRLRFYSALAGRAQAGWLQGREEGVGGPAGWRMERTPGLPWQLAVGAALLRARPWGLRVPVCGDWLFPELREGQGGVARPGPRARSSAWEGNARFLLEAALPSPRTETPALPTAPRAGRSKRGCERGALLEGCLQFGAICGGLARGPGV